ncbi:uncharacterized protein SCHCODRAFT_02511438, partial [Schizophyllum commune H4-8]|uniref:uncharacterized protein n=1 Tax=Schizophyllum commune (strain H4-8 / FGSC 9210) TaxID=578458 RepID=UPI0021605A4D
LRWERRNSVAKSCPPSVLRTRRSSGLSRRRLAPWTPRSLRRQKLPGYDPAHAARIVYFSGPSFHVSFSVFILREAIGLRGLTAALRALPLTSVVRHAFSPRRRPR